ncbi:MAG: ABC transporter ATP-binding protein [Deinococcota bacterium]
MSEAVIVGHDLAVGYPLGSRAYKTVLSEIDLSLHRGEFACLLGPNGAGKSTLLRTLAGTQTALQGTVSIGGVTLHRLAKKVLAQRLSVVLTDRLQVGNLTVYELISLGRFPYTGLRGRLTARDHQAVRWAIQATHLDDLAQQMVTELSDGQRQRVMIARALAQEPEFMLLDEPTAFLDLPTRVEITGLLRRLARQTGLAVLMTTHDLDLALRSADTLWLITEDGRFICGTPEDLVLNGTFETTFVSNELDFDRELGGFRYRQPKTHPVLVEASGLSGIWLRRALERKGYAVVTTCEEGSSPITITALSETEKGALPSWQIESAVGVSHCEDIGTVIAHLSQNHSVAQ